MLRNAKVWTVDPSMPEASWVAIAANRIIAIGTDDRDLPPARDGAETIDVAGRLILPGFVDAHTHFENAVRGFFDLRLNHIDSEAELVRVIEERSAVVPKEWWITGGHWSLAAAARTPQDSRASRADFFPALADVDRVTPDRPVLLRRYDGAAFINTFGMRLLHLTDDTPDPAGGVYQRDQNGRLTGVLLGTASRTVNDMLPPHNMARSLVGARALLSELNRLGIVGIHDIARIAQISESQIFQTHVERSFTDMTIFTELRDRQLLSVRVNAILTLRSWRSLQEAGIVPNSGDELISYSALKAFVGGFWMFRPFRDKAGFAGSLSFRNRERSQLVEEIVAADNAGWDVAVHVTGDRGHALVVDTFERAVAANPPRDRRHRLVHAWYPRLEDIKRAGTIGVFGDITPQHLIREMDSIPDKLYDDQVESAFAWRDMVSAGWRLNIVSDWPGSFDGNHEAPVDPLRNISLAVTRRPAAGGESFHPHQALTTDEAIEAYTMNPARAARAEEWTGSITPGKVADLVVLSDDIRSMQGDEIADARVEMTVFDGRIVHDRLR